MRMRYAVTALARALDLSGAVLDRLLKPVGLVMAWLIRGYQLGISPMLGPACRFEPSCSEYTRRSILRHGPLAGGTLGVLRICRCHPFNAGGLDPAPDERPRLAARAVTPKSSAPPSPNAPTMTGPAR
jgi:putative membrane protein insertion efficiency factor